MTKNNKKSKPLDERYICAECGTEVPTEEAFCPNCGAPMEHYSDDHLEAFKGNEDDDIDLENLEEGIDQEEDPLHESLDKMRDEEEADDDDYDSVIRANSDE